MSKPNFLQDKYAKVGFWSTLTAGVCCFTPLLVWIFAAAGLTAYVAYIDYVLLPALIIFLTLLFYGWKRYNKIINAKG